MAFAPVAPVRENCCVGGGGDTQGAMDSAVPSPAGSGQRAAVTHSAPERSVPSGYGENAWKLAVVLQVDPVREGCPFDPAERATSASNAKPWTFITREMGAKDVFMGFVRCRAKKENTTDIVSLLAFVVWFLQVVCVVLH